MSNSDNIPTAAPIFGIRGVPPAVQACFPTSDPDCFPADRLPPALSSLLLEEVADHGAGLCAVAAGTLLATAAAIGGSMRLEIEGGRTIGPTFNLCYAVPAFVRNAGAIEPVISPLRHRVQGFQNWAHQQEAALARKTAEKTAEMEAARRSVSPDDDLLRRITFECAHLHAGATPEMLLDRFSLAAVARALPASLDPGLLYLSEGVDPTDAWHALPRSERDDLSRQLNLSWDGSLRPAHRAAPVDLNVLWVTTAANVPALYANWELLACSRPVPMLLLTDVVVPPPSSAAASDWDEKVSSMLDVRLTRQPGLYKLDGAAADEFSAFLASFRQRVTGLALEQQRHLAFLPDLARRIALLGAIFENSEVQEIRAETMLAAIALAEWFGLAHAVALSELPAVDRKLTRPDSRARADKKPAGEVMLAKITLKAPVTQRQLRDCYDKTARKGLQAVLDGLIAAGKVCWLGRKHLVPTDWHPNRGGAGELHPTPTAKTCEAGVASA